MYHFPSNFPIYLKSGGDGYLVEITTKNGKVRDLDFVILTLESKKASKRFHSFHWIVLVKIIANNLKSDFGSITFG